MAQRGDPAEHSSTGRGVFLSCNFQAVTTGAGNLITSPGWNDRGPSLSVFVFLCATPVTGTNGMWKLGLTHTCRRKLLPHTHSFNNEWKLTKWANRSPSFDLDLLRCLTRSGVECVCWCVCWCVSNWSVDVTRSRKSGAASRGVSQSIGVQPLFRRSRRKYHHKFVLPLMLALSH